MQSKYGRKHLQNWEGQGMLVKVIYIKSEDEIPITRDEDEEDKLGRYIRVYNRIAIAGYAAPLVLHIADENMK
jgi:hypothetical protein